ncbi:hypothetical protein E2C01_087895 [Portunus trituberculatus]|uniref:Uncharacterized protein n=1 Tax=Portunus trituberculatus TaxID=210409 RepID=A0A5B7JD27_PORTR|nr:hypothetical protein [Portunus trituberculatus]
MAFVLYINASLLASLLPGIVKSVPFPAPTSYSSRNVGVRLATFVTLQFKARV